MTAVTAGEALLMRDSLSSAVAHIRQGSLPAVGLSSAEHHPAFPDMPTRRQQGFDLVREPSLGLSGPAHLPAKVVHPRSRERRAILAQPEIPRASRRLAARRGACRLPHAPPSLWPDWPGGRRRCAKVAHNLTDP